MRVKWIVWLILAGALALRIAHWLAVRGEPFFAQLIVDSKEYDAWAQGIVAGDWLGRGVFFQAPLYPYLLAGIYGLFGRSLDAVYVLQSLAAVGGIWALIEAGRTMGGERIGWIAGALAAVYGPFIFYDVLVLKESLAVTAASVLLWRLAVAWKTQTLGAWLGAGVLLGILALLRENALLLIPFLLPLALRRGFRERARRAGAFVLGVVLPLAPVALRNGAVGGSFLPTTSQGGVNFYIGNNAHADGTYRPVVPGKQIPSLERAESTRVAEAAAGRRLSPAEVSSYWVHAALSWAASHPAQALRLQIRKLGMYWSWYEWPDAVDYYWTKALSPVFRLPLLEFSSISLLSVAGALVLWRKRALGAFAPAGLFAAGWMLATIVFFLFSRYRLPAIPAHLLLGAAAIVAVDDLRRQHARRWWIGGAAVIATLLLSLIPIAAPRRDLVEFNLGRLADERGDARAAKTHYRAALAADPSNFLACLNLGTSAAMRQDWPEALTYYRRAVALEPASDDAECNLGSVLLETGDLDGAATHLDRALALNPTNLVALESKTALLVRSGHVAEAKAVNRQLLQLDPKNPAGIRMRDRLSASEHEGTSQRK